MSKMNILYNIDCKDPMKSIDNILFALDNNTSIEHQGCGVRFCLFEKKDDGYILVGKSRDYENNESLSDESLDTIKRGILEKDSISGMQGIDYRGFAGTPYMLAIVDPSKTYFMPRDTYNDLGYALEIVHQLDVLSHDVVTSLPKRELLKDEVESAKSSNRVITVVVSDVFGLKVLNDEYSYKKGDDLLKGIAIILEEVVGPYAKPFRWGGDEFVLISKPCVDEETIKKAMEIASKKIEDLQQTLKVNRAVGLDWGSSFGYAKDYDKLFAQAQVECKSQKARRYENNPDVNRRSTAQTKQL